jgi:TRAP-type uncharacterized transport system fused permease subunit
MNAKDIPQLYPTLINGFPFIISFVSLVWLIVSAKLESEAPFIASILLVFILLLINFNKIKLNQWLNIIVKIGEIIARIVSLLSGIGVIIGAMSLTGVGTSLSRELVFLAGGDLFMILTFGAIASLVLGIGMTVSACYIFLAIVLAPAIIQVGIDPIAAHLYVLYWGVLSFITPPVAIAAITASSISKTSALKTGFLSMRLGSILFFLPILFVFDSSMLMQGNTTNIIMAVLIAIFAIIIISASFEGYIYKLGNINKIIRVIFFISGVLILMPNLTSKYIGLIILIITTILLLLTKIKK